MKNAIITLTCYFVICFSLAALANEKYESEIYMVSSLKVEDIKEMANVPSAESQGNSIENDKDKYNIELEEPTGFESEHGDKLIFTKIGAIGGLFVGLVGGGAIGAGTSPYAMTIFVWVGGVIGFIPDMIINNYLYHNSNVGWIKLDNVTDTITLTNNANQKTMMRIAAQTDVYDSPGNKVISKINKNEYRRVIYFKYVNKDVWYKVKIFDVPIYKKAEELVSYEGWIKAKDTSSIDAQVGDIVYIENGWVDLIKTPIPPWESKIILMKNIRCEVLDIKTISNSSFIDRWSDGLWYRVKTQDIDQSKYPSEYQNLTRE